MVLSCPLMAVGHLRGFQVLMNELAELGQEMGFCKPKLRDVFLVPRTCSSEWQDATDHSIFILNFNGGKNEKNVDPALARHRRRGRFCGCPVWPNAGGGAQLAHRPNHCRH